MKVHIFNPEHDIALGTNVRRFTAPHAARQLRSDLGFLPALWADDGDVVVVDDVESALHSARLQRRYAADVLFMTVDDLREFVLQTSNVFPPPSNVKHQTSSLLLPPSSVSPWGWDYAVVELLTKVGLGCLAPSEAFLRDVREMSSRQWASENVLPRLVGNEVRGARLCGESRYLTDYASVLEILTRQSVLKAPWSSSGRGIRYVMSSADVARHATWVQRVIERQGGVMVEPYYNKLKDFGMEFEALVDGSVRYCGLSLFDTVNGAYTGSIIATEEEKMEILERWVARELLQSVSERICRVMAAALQGRYQGPFGVDMMVCGGSRCDVRGTMCEDGTRFEDGLLLLHPCVEVNLRRTMGHVALSLPCDAHTPRRVMSIGFDGDHHHLRIRNTAENLLNTSLCRM